MFCKNCGRQIPDNAAFCPACGTKRSGGETFGDERSGRDIKDLPNYAKERELNRSGDAIDSDRKKFSLSDSGQKKFSLSDSGQKKFSLSGGSAGQKKFSLSDKGKDSGDGIVRITSNREPAAPSAAPTGFVNPLKDSGKTVFHDEPVGQPRPATQPRPASQPQAEPSEPQPEETEQTTTGEPTVTILPPEDDENTESGGETGFVNPLKGSDQQIHWGSDGDRNETKNAEFAGDPAEINSYMGFAIFATICCCQPVTGIIAIVFAAQVSKHIQNGNYEAAKKSSDLAKLFCWISVILSIFCGGGTSVLNALVEVAQP